MSTQECQQTMCEFLRDAVIFHEKRIFKTARLRFIGPFVFFVQSRGVGKGWLRVMMKIRKILTHPRRVGTLGGGSWSVRPMERDGEMDSSRADG